jgi:NAD(P)H-hydrate epimerase
MGGSRGMSGAVYMSAQAALRSGAGLVCAGVPESLMQIMEIKTTEAMSYAVSETAGGLDADASAVEFSNTYDSVAFGMGAGRTPEVSAMLDLLLNQGKKPLVIDADGLFALSKENLKTHPGPVVLTPHSGEMARLCGCTVQEIESDRAGNASAFAKQYSVYVILKGAHTVIAAPDGRVAVNCLAGNSGMATAGSGDVLSGICARLLAICDDAFLAAQAAVYIHALAGDLAAEKLGEDGMLAGDILENLPYAILKLRNMKTEGVC